MTSLSLMSLRDALPHSHSHSHSPSTSPRSSTISMVTTPFRSHSLSPASSFECDDSAPSTSRMHIIIPEENMYAPSSPTATATATATSTSTSTSTPPSRRRQSISPKHAATIVSTQHDPSTFSLTSSSLVSTYPTLHPRYIIDPPTAKTITTVQTSLYGTVIRAFDTVCKCPVAIKISSRSLLSIHLSTQGESILEDVHDECRHMLTLHGEYAISSIYDATKWHHVVPLMDEREDDMWHYIVTPYYNGSDLFTYLSSQPNCRLSNDDHIHYLFTQLIDATQHLHHHNIAHRDITLENVLLHVNDDGTCVDLYLIDLGVAAKKNVDADDDDMTTFKCPAISQTSLKPGKLEYMSPELCMNAKWDAYANDVFALGTILYQMVIGQPPFDAADDPCAEYIISGTWIRHLRPLYTLPTPPAIPFQYDEAWSERHNHVDPYLLDLLTHLLCPQSQRYTIEQIQQHIWVKGCDDTD